VNRVTFFYALLVSEAPNSDAENLVTRPARILVSVLTPCVVDCTLGRESGFSTGDSSRFAFALRVGDWQRDLGRCRSLLSSVPQAVRCLASESLLRRRGLPLVDHYDRGTRAHGHNDHLESGERVEVKLAYSLCSWAVPRSFNSKGACGAEHTRVAGQVLHLGEGDVAGEVESFHFIK
jgi:hypothetical protein